MISRHISSRIGRASLAAAILTVSSLAAGAPAMGQGTGSLDLVRRRFEIRPVAGGYLATGDQRDLLENAGFFGAQLGWRLNDYAAVVGSLGWAPSSDKVLALDNKVDLYQYDVGVEGHLPAVASFGSGSPWELGLFAGLGAGGRTYDFRDRDVDAETNFVGYGALGFDLAPALGRLSLRVEARDYVSAFKGLRGELNDRKARNDVTLSAGVGFRF